MIYLITLFSIFYFLLAWRRLDWALMFLIAALPSYLIRFQILGIPMTVLEMMIFITFAVWFSQNYKFIIVNLKLKIKNLFQISNFKFQIINYPFGWELSLLIIIAWVSALIAGFNNEALGIWKAYFFEPALLFIVVLNVFKANAKETNNERKEQSHGIEKIMFSLTISAFAVSVLAIYQKITGNLIDNPLWAAEETRRVVSFFGYPNAVGLYLGPIVIILIGWLFYTITNIQETITKQIINDKLQMTNQAQMSKSKKFKFGNLDFGFDWKFVIRHLDLKTLFIAITILFSLLSIYYAKSEGAVIGIIAALFVFGILAGGKLRWATLIGTVIIGAGLMAYQPTRHFAVDKFLLRDFSGQVRRQQWIETCQMLASSPTRFIFGTGLANYQTVIKPFHQEGIFVRDWRDPDWRRLVVFNDEFKKKVWRPVEIYLYPHNIALNFWTELGIVGMFLFVWIFMKYLYFQILNLKFKILNESINFKYLNIGLICAMIVILVHGLVDVPYFKNDLAAMFWILVALVALINFSKSDRPEINWFYA